jgi:hypothetical protein
MKKISLILLVFLFIISFSGCSGDEASNDIITDENRETLSDLEKIVFNAFIDYASDEDVSLFNQSEVRLKTISYILDTSAYSNYPQGFYIILKGFNNWGDEVEGLEFLYLDRNDKYVDSEFIRYDDPRKEYIDESWHNEEIDLDLVNKAIEDYWISN